jgi:ornithine carbamoyltransferase
VNRHFLEVDDLNAEELSEVLDLAASSEYPPVLAGQGVALLFEKPSARTRNSTEVAVFQLGGHPVSIRGEEVGLDTRESAEDIARVLAGYHGAIGARVIDHRTLVRMAGAIDGAGFTVPVVNLLSDLAHPCQAVADVLTIREVIGETAGVPVAYVGDANNVLRSLSRACALVGSPIRAASPSGYSMAPDDVEAVRRLGGDIELTDHPEEAVKGAAVIYTDVWTSMGQEAESQARRAAFEGFMVDQRLVDLASDDVIVMHCLPAHRGEEISAEVVDGARSVVWRQSANRTHSVRGILAWLLTRDPARGGAA